MFKEKPCVIISVLFLDVRLAEVTSYSKTWVQVASTNDSLKCLTDTRLAANRKPALVRRGQDQCVQVEIV